jgi:hypothetical protein
MKWKDLTREQAEAVQSMMFAEQLGIIRNDGQMFTRRVL